MKTVVIIGSTRTVARRRLEQMAPDNGIRRLDFYDEATLDGHRLMAIGGSTDDVCWLRGVGFTGVEIVTVGDGISEEMWKRIRHVRSTNKWEHNAQTNPA